MKDLNWVVGVKRLYLVVWAGWFLFLGFALIHDNGLSIHVIGGVIGFGVLIPLVIYKASQWIYAGTQSKQ